MAQQTAIEWADATLNFWIGCTKVSIACDNCYAEAWGKRFGVAWGAGETRRRTVDWVRKAKALERLAIAKLEAGGGPFLCFSNSLSDILDNEVPIEWLAGAFTAMRAAPHVTFLLLTKRETNIVKRITAAGGLPPNAAVGVSIVNQDEANRIVPRLLRASEDLMRAGTPAEIFVSCEPLQGPIDFTSFQDDGASEYFTDALRGKVWMKAGTNRFPGTGNVVAGRDYVGLCHSINWVIVGGESGPNARPMQLAWVRELRDQCAAAFRRFLFKQWGEWVVEQQAPPLTEWPETTPVHYFEGDPEPVWRVGKRWTGRMLDGQVHDERLVVR